RRRSLCKRVRRTSPAAICCRIGNALVLPPPPPFVVFAMAFIVVNLKLAAEPSPLPFVVAGSQVGENTATLHVNERAQHTTHMDPIIGTSSILERRQHSNYCRPDHKPFHLDREDVKDDRAFRKQESICDKDAQNCARCADCRLQTKGAQQRF